MKNFAAATVIAWSFVAMEAQEHIQPAHPAPTAQPLTMWREQQLSVPGFSSWGPTECDSDLNLYFRIGEIYNETEILEMSKDGETHTTYTLPSEYANKAAFVNFRVAPDGTVYVLTESKDAIMVFTFQPEQSDPDKVVLQVPSGVTGVRPQNFAVSSDGNILLSGRFSKEAPKELADSRYMVLLDPSGKLLRKIDADIGALTESERRRPQDSPSAIDERGNFYLAQNKKIFVINASGKLLREFVPEAPDSDYRIGQIQIRNGRLVVWFAKTKPNRMIDTKLALYDAADDRFLGMYGPEEQLGNHAACFDGDSFLFVRVRNGFMNLATAIIK